MYGENIPRSTRYLFSMLCRHHVLGSIVRFTTRGLAFLGTSRDAWKESMFLTPPLFFCTPGFRDGPTTRVNRFRLLRRSKVWLTWAQMLQHMIVLASATYVVYLGHTGAEVRFLPSPLVWLGWVGLGRGRRRRGDHGVIDAAFHLVTSRAITATAVDRSLQTLP